jgi:hypothetical protein
MRFGVIVCPECRKVKAADLSFQTTRCINCNKVINLKNVRILYKSDSQEQIRQVIGKINAELMVK